MVRDSIAAEVDLDAQLGQPLLLVLVAHHALLAARGRNLMSTVALLICRM